ncbi:MAG: ParB/RepB/Spo0J family partition protein [Bacteroidales bacterium]|nr:ParB/RepB/Spo0J family partition protein [Bacteroidales bacterium]
MAKTNRGLGRGVGALLGDMGDLAQIRKPVGYINKEIAGSGPVRDTSDILRIPVDLIEPNPYQPRMTFDQEALDELAASIRTLGLIQPITVRRHQGGRYQIISGERRFRASRLAGLEFVPAYIRETDDQGMLEMAIVENIQRQDLDPIEVAMSYQRLMDECALTQEQMASRVGKKRASVANQLRLLKLPAKLQHDLKVGLLSVGHAKVLLGVEDSARQEELCDMVLKEGLSVRQLEQMIRQGTKPRRPRDTSEDVGELPDSYYRILEIVGRYFGSNISLKRAEDGKGSMTVRFSSDEEMGRFLEALEKLQ